MRTVFGMSSRRPTGSTATDRLRSFFQDWFTRSVSSGESAKSGLSCPTNGGMVDVRWEREDMRITLAVPRTARQLRTL